MRWTRSQSSENFPEKGIWRRFVFALPDQDVSIPSMLWNHSGFRKHTYGSVLSNQKGRLKMKMKIVATTIVIGIVATLMGCSQGISIGPGAYGVPAEEEVGQAQGTFSKTVSQMVLNQRETKALFLGKSLDKYFRDNYSIKFAGLPGGAVLSSGTPIKRLRLKTGDHIVPKKNAYSPLGISGWE